jgi:hypothetical protein
MNLANYSSRILLVGTSGVVGGKIFITIVIITFFLLLFFYSSSQTCARTFGVVGLEPSLAGRPIQVRLCLLFIYLAVFQFSVHILKPSFVFSNV